jgi:hypothetical protein
MKYSTKGDGTQTGIAVFLQFKPVFNNWVLNQIVMTWQIWKALPWTKIEDPYLRTAFQFANLKAVLYGQQWHCQKTWLGWLHLSLYRMRPSDSNLGTGHRVNR